MHNDKQVRLDSHTRFVIKKHILYGTARHPCLSAAGPGEPSWLGPLMQWWKQSCKQEVPGQHGRFKVEIHVAHIHVALWEQAEGQAGVLDGSTTSGTAGSTSARRGAFLQIVPISTLPFGVWFNQKYMKILFFLCVEPRRRIPYSLMLIMYTF